MPFTMTDIITTDPLPQVSDFLIYPWLYPGRLCLCVGATNIGKTTLTLELISQLLKGDHLWDRYPAKKISKVLYLHAEHTLATLQEAASHRGDLPSNAITVIHEFGENGPALLDPNCRPTPCFHELRRFVADFRPNLIIAEPISAFIGTSENDNHEARMVVSMLANLGASVGASVLSHHHVGKAAFDPDKTAPEGIASGVARGAMAFEDAAESIIYLKRSGKKGENHMRIETPKAKGFPISPVTIAFDEDTLSYTHVPQPFQERDLIAIYDRVRKHPNETNTDLINYFRNLWTCTPNKVVLMMRRAVKVGLLPSSFI
jgi:RecA-family ATPase